MSKQFLVLLCILLFCLTSCEPIEPLDSSTGQYSAQYPQTALEYNLFMTKHLNIVAAQLTARMTAIKNSDSSISSLESSGVKESYSVLLEEINLIKGVQPPKTYESTRETALISLDVIKQHYESYIACLENGDDVSSYAGIFENDFNEITGLYSLYNN